MEHKKRGFTLLELIIVIVLLGIITAMSMSPLQALIRGASQQSGIVSSQFEMSLGLELLRSNIEGAGLGLPDSAPSLVYQEASVSPQDQFNDASGADKTPRAIIIGNNLSLGGK
jgi:type IV pilus assembly protein PilW